MTLVCRVGKWSRIKFKEQRQHDMSAACCPACLFANTRMRLLREWGRELTRCDDARPNEARSKVHLARSWDADVTKGRDVTNDDVARLHWLLLTSSADSPLHPAIERTNDGFSLFSIFSPNTTMIALFTFAVSFTSRGGRVDVWGGTDDGPEQGQLLPTLLTRVLNLKTRGGHVAFLRRTWKHVMVTKKHVTWDSFLILWAKN